MNKYQPDPVPNDSEPLWNLVVKDMQDRNKFGTQQYGTPLQASNGRDFLQDLYEELLDAVVYIKGCMIERDNTPSI